MLFRSLRDAWERLRDTAADFGEQRIYASHNSIMFSRKACYFFVRPKQKYLELVIFLGRVIKSPKIRSVVESSKAKRAHVVRITHRDEVEAPITHWLQEAYNVSESLNAKPATKKRTTKKAAKPAARAHAAAPGRRGDRRARR